MPHFGHLDAREIKYSNILSVFNTIFDSNNPRLPRLETIKRAKTALRNILAPALKDRYIEYDPTLGLEKEFPSIKRYYIDNDIDTRLAALTKENDLREFVDSRIAERNLKDIILLDSMLYERRAYKKAVEDGLSLDEFGDSKAVAEFGLFFNEIVKYGNEKIK